MKITQTALYTGLAVIGLSLTGCNNKPAENPKPTTVSSATTSTTVTSGTATSTNSAAASTTATSPAAGKAITIATEGTYKPFSLTKADGTLGGFDVELMQAICDDIQAKCTFKPQDWDGLLPGLMSKKYDVVVDALSMTPERQAQVDFSDSYFTNTLVFVTKKGSAINPDDAAQIDSHSVAAQRSTLSSQWMEKNHPKAKLKLYDTIDNAFLDLSSGRSDMMISDKAPALDWLKSPTGQNFEVKGKEIDVNDKMGFAVRKGDPLKDQINIGLAHVKANGTYDKISQKYFGATTVDKPATTATTTTTSTTTTTTKTTS